MWKGVNPREQSLHSNIFMQIVSPKYYPKSLSVPLFTYGERYPINFWYLCHTDDAVNISALFHIIGFVFFIRWHKPYEIGFTCDMVCFLTFERMKADIVSL